MRIVKSGLVLLLLIYQNLLIGQVNGGQFAFEYLRLSNAPAVSALGGINVANNENDVAFAVQNPALMKPSLHNQLDLDYNGYYSGISIMNLQYGYNLPQLNTAFFLGIQYLNYGTITQTDNIGNSYGSFQPVDYAISLGASRSYGENWRYGADVKIAHSFLYTSSATAILTDIGINYYNPDNFWDVGACAKNMGVMIKEYTSGNNEPIPFDLQIGVAKQLKHVPLKFFVTLHHLYEWDIMYNNPNDISTTGVLGSTDTNQSKKSNFSDVLFRHFIFGTELSLAKKLSLTVSYNDLKRRELSIPSFAGITGFSFGINLHLKTMQIHYARSYYHLAGAYNELSLTLELNKLFGLGKFGEKINWNASYEDNK